MPDREVHYFRTRGGGRRKLTREDVQFALDQYEDGEPIREICQWFGIAPSTLYSYLRPYLEPRDDT
jgi:transposase-like protein